MNTENYGHNMNIPNRPNMNIAISSAKTDKLTIIEIEHSKDLLRNVIIGTGILLKFEEFLGTKLMPSYVYDKGFFLYLSEDKIITIITELNSLVPFCNIPKDENGQLVVKKSPILRIIRSLKTLL